MKQTTLLKNSNHGTAVIASACLILLGPLTGHASNNDEQLWTVSSSGDLQALTVLVKQNAELVSAHDRYGKLPLHYAAEAGQIVIVKFLLANGANIMERDNRGWTALHHAANSNHAEMMKLLVANGAEVDALNTMNWTPLHLAALKKDKTMVIALINAGADVYAKTSRGLTPYNLAVDSGKCDIADHLVASMVNRGQQAQPSILAIAQTTKK